MFNQQAMIELKELLMQRFPDDIEKVILYGSRVTGEARKYSDYDILIILKNDYDWKFRDRIYDATYAIDLKHDIVTDMKFISTRDLNTIKGKQPFIQDALECGVVL
jgi:predicted nucleotidyltransferase